jgi:hypothetical protein
VHVGPWSKCLCFETSDEGVKIGGNLSINRKIDGIWTSTGVLVNPTPYQSTCGDAYGIHMNCGEQSRVPSTLPSVGQFHTSAVVFSR